MSETTIEMPKITGVHLTGEAIPEVHDAAESPNAEENVAPTEQLEYIQPPTDTVSPVVSTPPAATEPIKAEPEDVSTIPEFEDKEIDAEILEKVKAYLKETEIDYSALSDEEMLALSLREEYPKASPKEIQILMKRKLQSYNITGDEAEDEDGIALLKLDMDKMRDAKILKQKDAKIPTVQHRTAPPVNNEETKQVEAYKEFVKNNPELAAFEMNKKLSFGDFTPVIPETFTPRDTMNDPNKFWSKFATSDGGINTDKLMKTLLIAEDPDKFISDAYNAGKTAALQKEYDEDRNPSLIDGVPVSRGEGDANSGKPKITNVRMTGQIG